MGEGLKRAARERPILFSSEMVRAILESQKSQTRWVVKPQPNANGFWKKGTTAQCDDCGDWFPRAPKKCQNCGCTLFKSVEFPITKCLLDCPYGVAGDRLWVRDSRITLEITKVRVERLQDISEEDAKAEGVSAWDTSMWLGEENDGRITSYDPDKAHPGRKPFRITKRTAYATLWDSLHGKGAWEKNPWVFVIEFKRA